MTEPWLKSYADISEDLWDVINDILDQSRENVDEFDWHKAGDAMHYLHKLTVTAANIERNTASSERITQIDAELKSISEGIFKAITRIEFFSPRKTNPTDDGVKQQGEEDPLLQTPLVQTKTIPLEATKVPPTPSTSKVQPTTQPTTSNFDQAAFTAILEQIKTEFSKILADPNLRRPTEQVSVYFNQNEPGHASDIGSAAPEEGADANKKASKPTPKRSNKSEHQVEKPVVQLQFDKVILGTFNGDPTTWIAFRDEFLEYVHNNENLSAMMKFHQLKTHLGGIALDAINGFSMCSADYNAAWQLLIERYDNEHVIVMKYIQTFFDLPYLSGNPSSNDYLKMINSTCQLIRVLPTFHYDVSSWDPILLYSLTARLDPYSLRKWMDQIKKRQRIALSELLEFLEVQSTERVVVRSELQRQAMRQPTISKSKKNTQKPRVLVTTEQPKTESFRCIVCRKGDHPTFMCKAFYKLKVKARLEKVKEAKHCIRCLKKHDEKPCDFPICKHCKGSHNHTLCFKAETARAEKAAAESALLKPASQ